MESVGQKAQRKMVGLNFYVSVITLNVHGLKFC